MDAAALPPRAGHAGGAESGRSEGAHASEMQAYGRAGRIADGEQAQRHDLELRTRPRADTTTGVRIPGERLPTTLEDRLEPFEVASNPAPHRARQERRG